jgi:hypothetical protein
MTQTREAITDRITDLRRDRGAATIESQREAESSPPPNSLGSLDEVCSLGA